MDECGWGMGTWPLGGWGIGWLCARLPVNGMDRDEWWVRLGGETVSGWESGETLILHIYIYIYFLRWAYMSYLWSGFSGYAGADTVFSCPLKNILWVCYCILILARGYKIIPVSVLIGFSIRGQADISCPLPSLFTFHVSNHRPAPSFPKLVKCRSVHPCIRSSTPWYQEYCNMTTPAMAVTSTLCFFFIISAAL